MLNYVSVESIEGNKVIAKNNNDIVTIEVSNLDKSIIEQELQEGNNIIAIDKDNNLINDPALISKAFHEMKNDELAGIDDELETEHDIE